MPSFNSDVFQIRIKHEALEKLEPEPNKTCVCVCENGTLLLRKRFTSLAYKRTSVQN